MIRVHHRRVILMQKMQNFSGEEQSPLPRPPPPQRLDLKPSHSEILPTLVEVVI